MEETYLGVKEQRNYLLCQKMNVPRKIQFRNTVKQKIQKIKKKTHLEFQPGHNNVTDPQFGYN